MEKMNIKTPCRSEEIIAITSRWLKVCERREQVIRPLWYLYWMACGFWPTDDQRVSIIEWAGKLDMGKPEAVAVCEYLRVVGLT